MDLKKIPTVVVVTCARDLPLLEFQAQSVCKYLDRINPIVIVVNETDPEPWFDYFNQHIRHYYNNHDLTILTRKDFPGSWAVFKPHMKNPWGVGWQTQQVLKLAVSEKLQSNSYLILDSQNFLISPWSACYQGNLVPYRTGTFVMPKEAYYNYAAYLALDHLPDLSKHYMSMCTPFYMHTNMVQKLIASQGGLDSFIQFFHQASAIRSEFMLYAVWLEKHGGVENYHTITDDFGHPMLRDSRTHFDHLFMDFLLAIGDHAPHAWVSVNHRSWGDMSDQQYQLLCRKLSNYGLVPRFEEYRANYVDYKF